MASVHAVMPDSFIFDSTLPPKLDKDVGAKSHFFQPPKTPSASSSLYKSTTSFSIQDVSVYPSRKRSRHDSHVSEQATPVSERSHAGSSISPTTPSLETPGAMSPVPFVSTKYELAGGLDTPAAAISSAMEDIRDYEPDLHVRGGRACRGFDVASESYFPYLAPSLARESNGRPRLPNPPRIQDGLGKAVCSLVGAAGRMLEFCKATAFRGFYAGGGQGYDIKAPLQFGDGNQSRWLDKYNDSELRTFERQTSTVPGGFPEEDFIPEYMTQDHTTPPRGAKKLRREDGQGEIGASWVLIASTPTSREGSPSRLSKRKLPSSHTPARKPIPRPSRRPILAASRPSQTSFAGSPTIRADCQASFASPRSPMISPTKRASPVSVDVQRHAARMRKRELEEDANLKRFNQQLKAMIKEGKEALGTKFEVEEAEGNEPMDEGYAEGSYFDEKWKG